VSDGETAAAVIPTTLSSGDAYLPTRGGSLSILGHFPWPIYNSQPKSISLSIINWCSYGANLLPGEGSALASYVQSGKRIPRRGEIGLTTNEIQTFEQAGYVMSGSRNVTLTAVRERKETQVMDAEAKRLQLIKAKEDRLQKETKIVADFREIVADKVNKARRFK
jgi:hypothetical protein